LEEDFDSEVEVDVVDFCGDSAEFDGVGIVSVGEKRAEGVAAAV
jgi:hypothetical protein